MYINSAYKTCIIVIVFFFLKVYREILSIWEQWTKEKQAERTRVAIVSRAISFVSH